MTKQEFIEGRTRPTNEVIADLSADVKPYAYVVGAWVWIEFPEKPTVSIIDELKAGGFTWNNRRRVWQNPCGVFRPASSDDPRGRFGAIPVNELQESEL